jgi:DNA-binding SARP family transcriptional activator
LDGLEFRILGPLAVVQNGAPLELGPPRQRALLALLLLHAGEALSSERIVDELWAGDPPSTARHSVQVYVANLRKVIEAGGHRGASPEVIVSRAGGYGVVLGDHVFDAEEFDRLVADGQQRVTSGDVEGGSAALRDALDLWRGPPLADFANEEFAVRRAARLDEARLAAIEAAIDADLDLGRHAALVPELEQLVRTYPLRERMWGQLMVALYRCGRQSDALRAYQRVRDTLRDELGLEPSAELRRLESKVLEQSPTLDLPGTEAEDVAPSPDEDRHHRVAEPAERPGRRRTPILVGGGVVAVIVLIAAIALVEGRRTSSSHALPSVGYTPRFVATRCPATFAKAVPNGTCGDLIVPEDRTHPDRRWIHLHVTRSPARVAHPAQDVAVDLDNGGVLEDPVTSPARDRSDLVVIADRLSKAPNPQLACPEVRHVATALADGSDQDPAVIAEARVAYRRCHDFFERKGVALDRYTLADAAGDLTDLFHALHLDRVDLAAEGDDVLTAFAVVRAAPAVVRSLTLENPLAPGQGGGTDPTAELTRAFDAFVRLCDADATCGRAYPDLAATYHGAWLRATAHPFHATGKDQNGDTRTVLIDGARSAKILAQALTTPADYGLIPAAIASPPEGPVLPLLVNPASSFDYYWTDRDFPLAAVESYWCSEEKYTISPGKPLSDTTRPDLAGVDDGALKWSCESWPVPKASDATFAPFVSSVPTFIIEGDLAWYTSPGQMASLQSNLIHSAVIHFATLGADVLGGAPPCLNDLRRRFLADPLAALDTRDCGRQTPRINFVAPAN